MDVVEAKRAIVAGAVEAKQFVSGTEQRITDALYANGPVGAHFKIREAANPIEIMRVDWLGQRVTLTNDDGSTVVMRFAEGRWEREEA